MKKTVWWPFNTGAIIMIEYGKEIEKTELFRRIVLI